MTSPDTEALEVPASGDLIAFCIIETLGERCEDFDVDCYTCQAWEQYDALASQAATIADLRKQVGVKHDEANRYVNEMIDAKARTNTAESRVSALSAEVERMRGALIKGKAALGDLLRCEYESNGKWGLADFIDNCGQPYQSADLDRCIKAAEETITAIDASLNGGSDHE